MSKRTVRSTVEMPPLGDDEYAALKADIEKRGQQIPVEIDADTSEVLDGANRLRICDELGIEPLVVERHFATQPERIEQALKLNILRRHMDPVTWGEQFKRLAEARGVKLGRGGDRRSTANVAVGEIAAELGVAPRTAERRIQAASLPEPEKTAIKEGAKTVSSALRDHKQQTKRTAAKTKNEELVAQAPAIHTAIDEPCSTLVIDPPWDFSDEGDVDQMGRGRPTYETMTLEEITALPIPDLAASDAHLYLWITNRSLPKGFDLLEGWGFRYVTCLTWVKPSIGMGNYFRGSTEHVLFGVRGSLPLLRKDVGTHFSAKRGGSHSAKPTAFYDLVESCSPGPWLELFAGRERKGWRAWGAEAKSGR